MSCSIVGGRFKTCFVPGCPSSTRANPDKHFFRVPRDQLERLMWFTAVKPGEVFHTHTLYYACEDHFDKTEDLVAQKRAGAPMKLRKGVVPHLLVSLAPTTEPVRKRACPPYRTRMHTRASYKEDAAWTCSEPENYDAGPAVKLRKVDDAPVLDVGNNANVELPKEPLNIPKPVNVEHDGISLPFDLEEILIIENYLSNDENQKDPKEILLLSQSTSTNTQSTAPPLKRHRKTVTFGEIKKLPDISQQSCEVQVQSNVEKSILKMSTESVNVRPTEKFPLVSHQNCGIQVDKNVEKSILNIPAESVNVRPTEKFPIISHRHCGTQVSRKYIKHHFRSKAVQIKPLMEDAASQCDILTTTGNEKDTVDKSCSPIRILESIKVVKNLDDSSAKKALQKTYVDQSTSTQNFSEEKNDQKKQEAALQVTKRCISNNPKEYIGIDSDKLYIINSLCSSTGCSISDIRLTLMKIKMNVSFSLLSQEFNVSSIQAITIFNKTVGLLANSLKKYIYTPEPEVIKRNLPISFREKYSNVCVVVDALEVDIEKPLDPLRPVWPSTESKKFCTLKYLISCTPDGLINFVSCGYGGNISDASLFRESKIINTLPETCGILLNREFDKKIEIVVSKKKCQLISMPLISTNAGSTTESLVSESSLKYNFEKTIRKINEYSILAPNAGLDISFMTHVDNIVFIVTALINLQR